MFKPNHLFVKFLRDAAYFAVLIETILLTLETIKFHVKHPLVTTFQL